MKWELKPLGSPCDPVPRLSCTYLYSLECCGLVELSGVEDGQEKDLRIALREARGQDYGAVIATTISEEGEARVEDLGFRKVFTFYNPNSGNDVTLWAGIIPQR